MSGSPEDASAILALSNVGRVYEGVTPVRALRDVSLRVERGEFVTIVGPSGSGKSTLLNLIALLDRPTSGSYAVDGVDTAALPEKVRTRMRRDTFGFVFQSFHLLSGYSAVENVEMAMLYRRVSNACRRVRALAALEQVGLVHRAASAANVLSGGERQRVALARAIVGGARVIVADEPTGNLDTRNSRMIVDLMRELNKAGATIVMVTHDSAVAAVGTRRVEVKDGEVCRTATS